MEKQNSWSGGVLLHVSHFLIVAGAALLYEMIFFFISYIDNAVPPPPINDSMASILWTASLLAFFEVQSDVCETRITHIFNKVNGCFFIIYCTVSIIFTHLGPEFRYIIHYNFTFRGIIIAINFIIAGYIYFKYKDSNKAVAGYNLMVTGIFFLYYTVYNTAIRYMRPDIERLPGDVITWAFWMMAELITFVFVFKETRNLSSDSGITRADIMEISLAEIKLEYALTAREVDILREITTGKPNYLIGDEFGISEGTVKSHIHNILKKLGVNTRIDAILLVQEKMENKKLF